MRERGMERPVGLEEPLGHLSPWMVASIGTNWGPGAHSPPASATGIAPEGGATLTRLTPAVPLSLLGLSWKEQTCAVGG